ncbi:MAG: arginine repressor [Clostridia bacterium]|nr:arginine repressor [Clostridia bacterium]
MKSSRQNAIIDIIENNDIETQEELIGILGEKGFKVTQATISRDIRELKLIKVTGKLGKYKYIVPAQNNDDGQHVYVAAFAPSVRSVDCALNLVIIKTYPGLANAVAANLDSQSELNIVGCVAGDDTIFAATRSTDDAKEVCDKIKQSLRNA